MEDSPTLTVKCRESVIKYAIGSRLIILFLQFISNLLIPDHDGNVFVSPNNNIILNKLDSLIQLIFSGFVRWDGQYFMHIANYGYTYENTVAFFPCFPLTVRYISILMSYIFPVLHFQTLLLLVSFTFNLLIFVQTALMLFDISLLFRNVMFAFTTSVIFCFNPASIFFSAPYSECLFFFLTLKSIHHSINFAVSWMQSNSINFCDSFWCVTYISLSAVTRSNGLLNIIFFIYVYIRMFADKFTFKTFNFIQSLILILLLILQVTLMLTPFIMVQVYDYYMFCSDFKHSLPDFLVNFGKHNDLILCGSFSKYNQSWCYNTLPLAYSYVQDHYWNVGFLKYYTLKQLPNFCLAMPVVYIVLKNSINYLYNSKQMLIHMGILRKLLIKYKIIPVKSNIYKNPLKLLLLDIEFACILHIFALTVFCILCIHIQVTTRMIFSSTPVIYWFCCKTLQSEDDKEKLFIKCYCILYFVLGTIIFCNFLPWT